MYKMGGSNNAEKPNEKNKFCIIYQRIKIQKVGSSKNDLTNYIKWKPKTISLSTMSCLIW
jgi:ABC-type uncharacterized transport system YnjBCD substrate-binding protein